MVLWYKVPRCRTHLPIIPDVVGNVSKTFTSRDLYLETNGDFEEPRFSLIVMKTLTVTLLLSVALIGSIASHAQSTPKKDVKTEEAKTPKTTTTSITSSTSITITKASGSAAFGAHLVPILAFVNATDDQRKSITEIVEEHKIRITALRKRHDELRDAFLKALTSGQTGENVLATQSDFIRAQSDLNAQYLAVRLKTQQVLTPEQNEKFKEYRLKQGWNSK